MVDKKKEVEKKDEKKPFPFKKKDEKKDDKKKK